MSSPSSRPMTLANPGSRPMAQMAPSPLIQQAPTWQPLASREVCHVGEAIVVVVAESRAAAEDAVALVVVDTEAIYRDGGLA